MSKTPRTKSEAIKYLAGMGHVACDRIEELETELAEARADADHWKGECNALQRMVHEARAEIERKDALIEQMREALGKIVELRTTACYENALRHDPVYKIARAALAAERGEG